MNSMISMVFLISENTRIFHSIEGKTGFSMVLEKVSDLSNNIFYTGEKTNLCNLPFIEKAEDLDTSYVLINPEYIFLKKETIKRGIEKFLEYEGVKKIVTVKDAIPHPYRLFKPGESWQIFLWNTPDNIRGFRQKYPETVRYCPAFSIYSKGERPLESISSLEGCVGIRLSRKESFSLEDDFIFPFLTLRLLHYKEEK